MHQIFPVEVAQLLTFSPYGFTNEAPENHRRFSGILKLKLCIKIEPIYHFKC